jgi:protein SCO1/2
VIDLPNWRRCWVGLLAIAALCVPVYGSGASQKYQASGMLLAADPAQHTITVSCKEIPGYMDAMVMSFPVHSSAWPVGLKPGVSIEFTLSVAKNDFYAENVRLQAFESLELDPTEARRLQLVENANSSHPLSKDVLQPGDAVPDFRFTDQNHDSISFSQFKGKVVALTFIYTRCPRPDYCLRLSNNFGVLQRRFKNRLGNDLVLLTVIIDPIHDQPGALQTYARTWKADSHTWHFLTGPVADIQRLCHRFDMSFYPDEALYVHSFHTVIIGRDGHLTANLEGNNFTAQQLGDLVETLVAEKERRVENE